VLETSARLLRLLSMLQARRFWSGAELAEHLEVTDRTLRRDVDRLRSLGYPVEATPGVAGGYQLGAGASLPPLLLEDDEALAISIGLRTASHRVSGLEEAALCALVKLERVLPPRLRRRADALRATIVQLDTSGPRVDSDVLTGLARARQEHLAVRFEYLARGKEATLRTVEPAGLVHTGYRWYLVAWDVDRSGWRTFRVDRICGALELGARAVPRPLPDDGDLRKYVSRSVSNDVYPHQAKIVFQVPLEVASEHVSPTAGILEPVDENSCRLITGAHSWYVLAMHLASVGVDFTVEEPPEFLNYLRRLHDRLGRTLQSQLGGPMKEIGEAARTAGRRRAKRSGA
jgi:predicted DNA-binding transcriptional regulator YafY